MGESGMCQSVEKHELLKSRGITIGPQHKNRCLHFTFWTKAPGEHVADEMFITTLVLSIVVKLLQ